jgi:hypothetical protein
MGNNQARQLKAKLRHLRELMVVDPQRAHVFEDKARDVSAELDALALPKKPVQEPVLFLVPPQHDAFINFRALCRNPGGEQ